MTHACKQRDRGCKPQGKGLKAADSLLKILTHVYKQRDGAAPIAALNDPDAPTTKEVSL